MTTTSDEQVIARLRAAMAEEVRGHSLDRDAAIGALQTPVRDRSRRRVYLAAVAAGIAAAATIAVGYVVSDSDSPSTAPPAANSCEVEYGVLPTWARAGFSDPEPVMPHVLSDKGDILAILWSRDHPLNAPPLSDQNNKILWVTPRLGAPLVIHARLGENGPTVTRKVNPGPSIVNMPSAGCWTFDLSWGGNRDTLRLPYAGP